MVWLKDEQLCLQRYHHNDPATVMDVMLLESYYCFVTRVQVYLGNSLCSAYIYTLLLSYLKFSRVVVVILLLLHFVDLYVSFHTMLAPVVSLATNIYFRQWIAK